jgi:hypothetical protein
MVIVATLEFIAIVGLASYAAWQHIVIRVLGRVARDHGATEDDVNASISRALGIEQEPHDSNSNA